MFERPHLERLIHLIEDPTNQRLIIITGPRQVGKTTLAQQASTRLTQQGYRCNFVSFDDPGLNQSVFGSKDSPDVFRLRDQPKEQDLIEIWEHSRKTSLQSQRELVLFLDEIQSIPNWSQLVKGLWDRDQHEGYPLQVVLLGSAPERILAGSASLVGRFRRLPVLHWTLREMSEAFGLRVDEYIFYGGYPGIFSDGSKSINLLHWEKYISDSILGLAINKDILAFEDVRKPSVLRQLIHLAPHYSGQIIAYNKLLGHLTDAGNTTTLARYTDLLSDTGLMTALTRYTPSPHTGAASPPKLIVLNTALMTAPSAYSFEEARTNKLFWGRILESAVGAHLMNTRAVNTKVQYWRDGASNEIDFVVARGPHLLGIEVKSGRLRSRRGLDHFKNRFPNATTIVVGPENIPLNEFFSLSTEEWLKER